MFHEESLLHYINQDLNTFNYENLGLLYNPPTLNNNAWNNIRDLHKLKF